jgi:hypothetical protein
MTPPNPFVSRRRLLASAAGDMGVGALLAACGGSDGTGTETQAGGTDDAGSGEAASNFTVVQRFQSDSIGTGPVRLPFSLADDQARLLTSGPARLKGEVRNEQGNLVATLDLPRRGDTLGAPYWTVELDIPKRGLYDFTLEGQTGDPTPFIVEDPAKITVPVAGTPLPPFDTPTTADARGVDPVCTRLDGACPFHEVTLSDALAAGKPVVYLVGTPAHCSTGTCAPGLEFLIEASKAYTGSAVFVHTEVFADQAGTKVAPAVTALGLTYEPVIWIADATGTVQRRIDVVWDLEELSAVLADTLS